MGLPGIVRLTPEEKKRQENSLRGRQLAGKETSEPWAKENWNARFQAYLESEQSGKGAKRG